MKIDEYDTCVRNSTGDRLHVDILLPGGEGSKATHHAKAWLQGIGSIQGRQAWKVPLLPLRDCR